MKITREKVLERLKNEEVVVFATTLYLVEPYTGSPHISLILKPTFGQVKNTGSKLEFFKEKANSNGFVSKGRLFDSLDCFDNEEEARTSFNAKIQSFVSTKQSEIDAALELLV